MDELMHYGVPGMKWGVRKKYEPKGRRRGKTNTQRIYEAVKEKSATRKARKAAIKEVQAQRNQKVVRRSVKDMSDEELRTAINRMQMERTYAQLTAPEVNKGKKFVQEVLYNSAKNVAGDVVKDAMKKAIKKISDRSNSGGTP